MKKKSHILEELLRNKPKELKNFIRISMDIASQISSILKKKNLAQKDLAKLLNKKESEISKWLSGTHNFEIKTIAKIEAALDDQIIQVPLFSGYSTLEFQNWVLQLFNDWGTKVNFDITENKGVKLSSKNKSIEYFSKSLNPFEYYPYEQIN